MPPEIISEHALYIDGSWVPATGKDCLVEDPAAEVPTGMVTEAGAGEVEAAITAARKAQVDWFASGSTERARLLRELHAILHDQADEFARLITREQGAPAKLARGLHVDVPLEVLAGAADAVEEFNFHSHQGNSIILREPVGVVAAITPWNLPLHQVIVKIAPALAAGCTVVLKPAELTPLTTYALARAIDRAGFPPGVFNLVSGGPEVGDHLARHPEVDHVSFTGSTRTGKDIAEAAATTIKGLTLELGGKSASVVLSDTSDELLTKAVKMTVANCFLNGGQTCNALSRLIVPTNRLDTVEELAIQAAAKQTPGERLGPLISSAQRDRVRRFLANATSGRKITSDLTLPETGYYVPPTVYSDVTPESALAQQEIFGPVVSIMPARSDDHAIQLANHSRYGLGGALWTTNTDHAVEAASHIRTGQIDINGAPFNPRAPFGGYKQSGLGREIGDYGISDVLEVKAVQL